MESVLNCWVSHCDDNDDDGDGDGGVFYPSPNNHLLHAYHLQVNESHVINCLLVLYITLHREHELTH